MLDGGDVQLDGRAAAPAVGQVVEVLAVGDDLGVGVDLADALVEGVGVGVDLRDGEARVVRLERAH